MNVKEVYNFLEELLTSLNRMHRDAATYGLYIETSEPHLSGQGIVPIEMMHIGFDWYKGKILLKPGKELVPKESHRDIPKKPVDAHIPIQYKPMIKPYYICPNCEEPLKKGWKYCPKCGQCVDMEGV